MADEIHIEQLELSSVMGTTPEERAERQRLTVSLTLEPTRGFDGLDDKLGNTIDYFQVCQAVQQLSACGERHLLETLAEEISTAVLREYPVRRVRLELRKFIVSATEFVAVRIERAAGDFAL